jgi:GNAT superfamily N-acetyltransferase
MPPPSVSNRTQGGRRARKSVCVLKRLPDGASILIRPIRADDKRMLEDGLRQLSDESVHRRFLTPKRGFSRTELRYLTEVDGRDHVALVAEDGIRAHSAEPSAYGPAPRQPVRRMIAVGRFVRLHQDPEAAEVAIVVADDWHRRGVGTALTEQLAADARRLGIRRFTATMAADNAPAHLLMHKLTSHLERHSSGGGVEELVLELAA